MSCHRRALSTVMSTISAICLTQLFAWSSSIAAASEKPAAAIRVAGPPKSISRDLVGIFFEDINYSADGGLYAELVQNRSFEYQALDRNEWHPLSYWEKYAPNDAPGTLRVADAHPIHQNNPHYLVVETQRQGAPFGLRNEGWDGIPVVEGKQYRFSIFARQLYTGRRWGADQPSKGPARLTARLESREGSTLGEASLDISSREWERSEVVITATAAAPNARLIVAVETFGAVAIDEVSLFPVETFRGRTNGLRADLAQTIADLEPKFVRFPGGCLVHGYGLGNMYRWKDSIGPVEQRRTQPNIWG
ncbi:MAG: hypothetical protein KDA61_10450, partial [Planctomycetales bacterium]|nr:hypothetical protein [Planctomycetales bacterium]